MCCNRVIEGVLLASWVGDPSNARICKDMQGGNIMEYQALQLCWKRPGTEAAQNKHRHPPAGVPWCRWPRWRWCSGWQLRRTQHEEHRHTQLTLANLLMRMQTSRSWYRYIITESAALGVENSGDLRTQMQQHWVSNVTLQVGYHTKASSPMQRLAVGLLSAHSTTRETWWCVVNMDPQQGSYFHLTPRMQTEKQSPSSWNAPLSHRCAQRSAWIWRR